MELNHLIQLISELTPNHKCKYVRGDEYCTFLEIEPTEPRVKSLTPLGDEHSISGSYLEKLAENIKEFEPFNISQLMNNSGSNRPVIESIIAHTSEFYWIQKDRARYVVWVPCRPHNVGELIQWENYDELKKMNLHNSMTSTSTGVDIPLQTIYFGSPGTGKSFKIKDKILKGVDDNYIFRTTFHPDTDYASFVGCYKPITNKAKKSSKIYTVEELAEIYKREVGPTEHLKTGHIEPRIMFGIEYCEYFGGKLANYDVNRMLVLAGKELATGCVEDRVGITYVKYGVTIGLKMDRNQNSGTITYDFAPQTFTNAYVKAWQNPTENVYLVIEEINRGNCAQIFGDLFQLLDRNDDGISEYPIKADADLTKYLQEELGADHEGIADGKIKLPANLYILATMNTSDQSLFPMDSAFKRRWEWQYVPTSVTGDKKKVLKVESKEEKVLINREQEQKVLKVGMYQYDWSLFLEKINKCITNATHSDDKQLGFWFVKTPKDSNEIKIETFVSKVIFYLWTDVFKDFGAKATNPFAFKTAEGGWVVCPFSSFFDPYTGEINLGSIHGFMYNLGIIPDLEPEIQEAINQRNEEEGNPEA